VDNVGIWLVVAALLMSPAAIWLLWKSARVQKQAEEVASAPEVRPEQARRRLFEGLEEADQAVQEKYAKNKEATPSPAFARGRHRVTVERPTQRRYM
jgi:hypothetical protein